MLYAFSLKKKPKKNEIKNEFNAKMILKLVIICVQARLCQVKRTISNCSKGSVI